MKKTNDKDLMKYTKNMKKSNKTKFIKWARRMKKVLNDWAESPRGKLILKRAVLIIYLRSLKKFKDRKTQKFLRKAKIALRKVDKALKKLKE